MANFWGSMEHSSGDDESTFAESAEVYRDLSPKLRFWQP